MYVSAHAAAVSSTARRRRVVVQTRRFAGHMSTGARGTGLVLHTVIGRTKFPTACMYYTAQKQYCGKNDLHCIVFLF